MGVNDKRQCFVCTAPFEGDVKFIEELTLEVADAKLKAEICMGDLLQQALKLLPKHIKEKREKESRKKQKERNRPIVVGTQRFINVDALEANPPYAKADKEKKEEAAEPAEKKEATAEDKKPEA